MASGRGPNSVLRRLVFAAPSRTNWLADGDSIQAGYAGSGYSAISPAEVTYIQASQLGWGRVSTLFTNISVSGQDIDDMIARAPAHLQPIVNTTPGVDNILLVWELTNQVEAEMALLGSAPYSPAQLVLAGHNAVTKLWTYCGLAKSYGIQTVIVNTCLNRGNGITLPVTVTDASNASPIVVTTSGPHGLVNGQSITILEAAGNDGANGTWTIAGVTPTTFELVGSIGTGAYTGSAVLTQFWEAVVAANAKVLAEFSSHCDGVADAASDPYIGGPNGNTNPWAMQDDGGVWVHPTFEGDYRVATHYNRALRGIYGAPYHPNWGPGLQYGGDASQPLADFKDNSGNPIADGSFVGSFEGYGWQQSTSRTVPAVSPGVDGTSWKYVAVGPTGKPCLQAVHPSSLQTPSVSRTVFEWYIGATVTGASPSSIAQMLSQVGGYAFFCATTGDDVTGRSTSYSSNGVTAVAFNANDAPWIDDGTHTYGMSSTGTAADDRIFRDGVEVAKTSVLSSDIGFGSLTLAVQWGEPTFGMLGYTSSFWYFDCLLSDIDRAELQAYMSARQ